MCSSDLPLENFRLGEQSDVYIVSDSKKNVPSLPSDTIVTKGTKRGVWVIKDSRLTFKEITLGIEDRRSLTEIVSGLDAGDRVAAASPANLAKFKEGMKVRAAK